MTLEAERQFEKKFRLKFGHLESELTRWKVRQNIILMLNNVFIDAKILFINMPYVKQVDLKSVGQL